MGFVRGFEIDFVYIMRASKLTKFLRGGSNLTLLLCAAQKRLGFSAGKTCFGFSVGVKKHLVFVCVTKIMLL